MWAGCSVRLSLSGSLRLHLDRYAMKRAYRLRRPDQFRRARREGRTLSAPLLLLNAVAGRHKRIRCGFVVGKQIGTAVRRNRAKRRVREAVRLALPHIAPGYDLVFVIRSPEVVDVSFVRLQESVEELLRRAQIWRPSPALTVTIPPSPEPRAPRDDR